MKAKTSFDRDNAKELAELSKLAYSPPQNISAYLDKYTVKNIFDSATDTQCFVASSNTELLVIFRGTSNLADWLTNLNFDKVNRGHNMHEGFHDAYTSVQSEIFHEVNRNKGKNIYIGGHSLGGALATLCAVDLHLYLERYVTACYTFGAPRSFSVDSASDINKKMGSRIHNIVNNNDIVTHLPTESLDFSHVGERAYFEEDGTLHVNEVFSWWQEKRYALAGRIDDLFELGTDGLKDHFIDNYIEYL